MKQKNINLIIPINWDDLSKVRDNGIELLMEVALYNEEYEKCAVIKSEQDKRKIAPQSRTITLKTKENEYRRYN